MAVKRSILVVLTLLLAVAMAGGGYYYGLHHGHDHGSEQTTGTEKSAKVQYTCSMHPFIIKDAPGTCPICGMELIKKNDAAAQGGNATPEQQRQADLIGRVALSPTQRVMANVATQVAQRQTLHKEINAVGIVQYDQTRQAKVTAWIAGRIDRLLVNAVGAYVSKDTPLAEVYSPELLATQQEYLLALKSREQLKHSSIAAIAQNGEGLVASARQRLLLFGVRENQIAALEKAGKPNIRLPVYTPLSGVVIEKLVQQGQYVNAGEVLFNIADLSRVWIEIDIFENEVPFVRVGQQVAIRSSADAHVAATGQISFIYPFHDPKTHTVKARVEMANSGMKLKPDMFVNAIIKVPLVKGIVVPVTAVIDTGKRQMVWVETAPGTFEPRDVQMGERVDDKVQILSGLKVGDKVAVSGGYLIDSESQLKGGGGQDHSQHIGAKPEGKGPAPAPAGHEGHGAPTAPAPAKKPLNMDDMKM
jgi:Cu(I)/Ag(I) efflux system membrane fusion protein